MMMLYRQVPRHWLARLFWAPWRATDKVRDFEAERHSRAAEEGAKRAREHHALTVKQNIETNRIGIEAYRNKVARRRLDAMPIAPPPAEPWPASLYWPLNNDPVTPPRYVPPEPVFESGGGGSFSGAGASGSWDSSPCSSEPSSSWSSSDSGSSDSGICSSSSD